MRSTSGSSTTTCGPSRARSTPPRPRRSRRRIRELAERLDAFSGKLRDADRHISPSYVRRFFEKVQPQDEKIAFHLLRFYFSQPDVDEDVVDKVDFLATVVAAGQSGAPNRRRAPAGRTEVLRVRHGDLRLAAARRDTAPTIVRAFDELAADMTRAQEFEDLVTARLLNNVRTMKRRSRAAWPTRRCSPPWPRATCARARSSTGSTSAKSTGWRRPPSASATSRRS